MIPAQHKVKAESVHAFPAQKAYQIEVIVPVLLTRFYLFFIHLEFFLAAEAAAFIPE